MSANCWSVCPACHAKELERQKKAGVLAGESYGKVAPEEYFKLLRDAEPKELEDSMRHDYQLGVDKDGRFYVSYRCSCNDCSFGFSFRHDEKVFPKPTKKK